MRYTRITLCVVFIVSSLLRLHAQDSVSDSIKVDNTHRFNYTELIIPATMLGVGIIGLDSDWLKFQNHEIRNELQESIDKKITIDDFSQYAPMVSVYALNLCGVKGKHRFRDRTMILGTAYLLMGVSVNALKLSTHVERPDNTTFNSFPSGHTATAFAGAQFLWEEYHEVSPWIGIAGYTVATGTAAFRMYNNRHWLTDVLAGAGIGILSTKAAYWLYPWIEKKLFRKSHMKNVVAAPYYDGNNMGLCLRATF